MILIRTHKQFEPVNIVAVSGLVKKNSMWDKFYGGRDRMRGALNVCYSYAHNQVEEKKKKYFPERTNKKPKLYINNGNEAAVCQISLFVYGLRQRSNRWYVVIKHYIYYRIFIAIEITKNIAVCVCHDNGRIKTEQPIQTEKHTKNKSNMSKVNAI